MNAPPQISVLLPVYNAQRYLAVAVQSILAQTFARFELIAVDDGSSDDSLAILRKFAARDERVRIITRPNTGIVGALNDAIAAARAPYLARMDADDFAWPERFALQYSYLTAHPNCVGLGSAVDFMDSRDALVMPCPRPSSHEDIEAGLLRGDGGMIIHPAAMFLRDAVVAIGGYRREAEFVEDLDLYLRLAELGGLANLSDTLLCYRVHATSINFTKNADRHQRKLRIMADAYRARGLDFNPAKFPNRHLAWGSPVRRYREWAASSLQFGRRSVAIRHGLVACRLEPFNRASWQALRYAMTAPMPTTRALLRRRPLAAFSL